MTKEIISHKAGEEFYGEKIGKRYDELATNAYQQVTLNIQVIDVQSVKWLAK